MRDNRPLWSVPAVVGLAMLGLTGCAGSERIVMRVQQWSCHLAGTIPKYDQCVEPFKPDDPPRFCYHTLARVDCYAEPVRFGPDIGWQRAAPPDLIP